MNDHHENHRIGKPMPVRFALRVSIAIVPHENDQKKSRRCVIAGVRISPRDWQKDVYTAAQAIGQTAAVTLERNVWIGDGAIGCRRPHWRKQHRRRFRCYQGYSRRHCWGNPAKPVNPRHRSPVVNRQDMLANGVELAIKWTDWNAGSDKTNTVALAPKQDRAHKQD